MATVMVNIDGKTYRMACDKGQEDHLAGLAGRFDHYIGHLKSSFGEIGDHRLSVMAGIMVMDEMSEMERRFAALEEEVKILRQDRDNRSTAKSEHEQSLAETLENITQRLIVMASRIAPKN